MAVKATTPGHLSWWTNDIGGLFKDYSWYNDLSTVESIVDHLLVMVGYAVLVKWFRNRDGFKGIMEPDTVKKVRYWHSMGLSIVSLIMGVLMILHVYHEGRFDSWYDSACRVSPSVSSHQTTPTTRHIDLTSFSMIGTSFHIIIRDRNNNEKQSSLPRQTPLSILYEIPIFS